MTRARTLEKLVSFRTVTGDARAAHQLMRWVKDELQPVPLYVRTYTHGGLPSLVITPTRLKRARLWLAAHIDVVDGPDAVFAPRIVGKRLYGRGAIDMKFAVACYVHLLRDLGVCVRDYDLGVMLTPDEERGAHTSVEYLLEREGYGGDVVFLPDGYGSWKFEESAKGIMLLELTTKGVAAHGSKPWHGRSAIEELCAYVADLTREGRARFCKADDPEHWYTSMNVGVIDGGVAFNVVAPHARAAVDVRYVSAGDRRALLQLLADLSKRYPHTRHRVTLHERPYGIGRTNDYATTFAELARELAHVECGWVRAHGASDARFFARKGMSTVLISPKGGDSHGDKEWVDLHDLDTYYDVLKAYVEAIAKK